MHTENFSKLGNKGTEENTFCLLSGSLPYTLYYNSFLYNFEKVKMTTRKKKNELYLGT